MKKLIFAFVLILFTSSCDDGELTIENFNFGTATPTTCNAGQTGFFIYKTSGKEVIILKIDESKFLDALSTEKSFNIPSEAQVIYRIYSDPISASFLCTSPPPTSPNVTEEWNAISGTVTILSTAITTEDVPNNKTRISGLSHEINIKNLNFKKPDGSEQLFTNFTFGNYKNTFTQFPESFGADNLTGICIESNNLTKLSKVIGSQSLVIEAPSIFALNNTNLNVETNYLINNNTIKLNYNLYKDATVSTAGICANSTPTLVQKWDAANGITNTSGIISVLKTERFSNQNILNGYKYVVKLKNIQFVRNGFIFKGGTSYDFGTFERNLN